MSDFLKPMENSVIHISVLIQPGWCCEWGITSCLRTISKLS